MSMFWGLSHSNIRGNLKKNNLKTKKKSNWKNSEKRKFKENLKKIRKENRKKLKRENSKKKWTKIRKKIEFICYQRNLLTKMTASTQLF